MSHSALKFTHLRIHAMWSLYQDKMISYSFSISNLSASDSKTVDSVEWPLPLLVTIAYVSP